MTRHLLAAFAVALLCACAGSTTGDTDLLGPDSGGGSLTDGGQPDGGQPDGGDAGPDAGCVQLTLNGVAAIDNCVGAPAAVASVSVAPPAHS